ncbi:unnamed protein product [Lasius platythorax]|uniref:Uncharacterized protein n=1 Tax=Lasius platythorax TaxID=488582 RepID=A0AAV2N2L9_9HYME
MFVKAFKIWTKQKSQESAALELHLLSFMLEQSQSLVFPEEEEKAFCVGGINSVHRRIINNLTGGHNILDLLSKERSFHTDRLSLSATLHLFPDQRLATHVAGTENEGSAF